MYRIGRAGHHDGSLTRSCCGNDLDTIIKSDHRIRLFLSEGLTLNPIEERPLSCEFGEADELVRLFDVLINV